MSWNLLDLPRIFFFVCFFLMWLAAQVGLYLRRRRGKMDSDEREELNLILTSSLTLLALIIGFSFSMAVGRYDLRKGDEATEATTIETSYLRAGTLGSPYSQRLRSLLQQYVHQRIDEYQAAASIDQINASTKAIQHEMWSIVESAAAVRPNSITATVVVGMTDMIEAEGRATASWANRIPAEAWVLMLAIAICCCGLIAYDTRISVGGVSGYMILPVLVAISFFLIADLDSPHGGFIRVAPDNLIATAQTMKG